MNNELLIGFLLALFSKCTLFQIDTLNKYPIIEWLAAMAAKGAYISRIHRLQ